MISAMAWNAKVNMRGHNHNLHDCTCTYIKLLSNENRYKKYKNPYTASVAHALTYLVVWWRTCAAAEAHQRPPCFCVNRTPVNVFKTNLETQQFPQSPSICRRLASVVPHKRAATTRCYLITLAQFAWDTLAKFDAKTFYVWHNECAWIWYPQYS